MIPRPELPQGPPSAPRDFDPDAPTGADVRLFDLPFTIEESRVVVVPVPYEATVTGGGGTADGPRTVIEVSRQIDLDDPLAGEPWRVGIALLAEEPGLRALSSEAAEAVRRLRSGDRAGAARADACAERLAEWLDDTTIRLLASGRTPIVLGGEHGISPGAIRAAAARHPGLGVLQIDAHADLRFAYEGLRSSHASAMRRVSEVAGLGRIVQVGLRDVSAEERRFAESAGGTIRWHADVSIAERLHRGQTFEAIARAIVRELPDEVWLTIDVDGLDPALCPATGTPVPGGLGWREACTLLAMVQRTGRRMIGADVVEVGAARWDALVASRLVYLLAGLAAGTIRG